MDFVTVYSFCEDMLQALVGMVQPIIWFFSLTITEWLNYLTYTYPPLLKPLMLGFETIVDFLGIGDTSILVFLFGSGIVLYLAFTFIKWILDIVL